MRYQKPKKDGVCDRDGEALIQRGDDTEEKVRKRLEKYHSETAAIVPFYEKRGIMKRVDSSRALDDVFRSVESALAGM